MTAPEGDAVNNLPHGFKDATTDLDQIVAWWTAHPDANIGIATGEVSNLTVVDVDFWKGGDVAFETLIAEHGDLPPTATVRTGSGSLQFYFAHAFTAAKGTDALGRGVDIKSVGGLVVAPPSIHPNGNAYRWETNDQAPAELPAWIVTMERPEGSTKINGGWSRKVTRSSTSSCHPTLGHQFRNEKSDAACGQALGLPLDRKFSCVLHPPDEHPSAWLFVGSGGDLLYRCEHEGGYTLTLSQVRASLAYGEIIRIKDDNGRGQKIEHLAWRLRLLHEAGAVRPVEVPHRTLPADARPAVKAVYAGFLLLLGLKRLIWPGNGTTFSWRFAAAWCDVGRKAAELAVRWLMEHRYIRSEGMSRSAYGKTAHVLVPSMVASAKRTPREWAIYRQEQHLAEALQGEPDDFEADRLRFEDSEAAYFDDFDYDDDEIDMDDFEGEGEASDETEAQGFEGL